MLPFGAQDDGKMGQPKEEKGGGRIYNNNNK